MIQYIGFSLIFISEILISLFYFDNKFERTASLKKIFLICTIAFIVLFLVILSSIPVLNMVAFYLCNLFILYLCFKCSVPSAMFHSIILVSLMIVTELVVILCFTFFDISIMVLYENDYYLFVQFITTKLFYLITIYFLIKFSSKEEKADKLVSSLFLSILPIASILIMITTLYINTTYNLNQNIKIMLFFVNILIFLSNIVVFFIHENTIKTNKKYTHLLLEKQHVQNNFDYYELLRIQNENQKVLIHDINKHLKYIRQMTLTSKDNQAKIEKYINNILMDFDFQNPIDYTHSPLLNLITYRFNSLCIKDNINFNINIRSAKIDFLQETDITALFDNLLENAYESALQTKDKNINFSIYVRNKNFLIINVSNSCAKAPVILKNNFLSTKANSDLHGVGTRSIKRVLDKYDANSEVKYDKNNHEFSVNITFKIPQQEIVNEV